jgi:alpha-N-arabinofuranosidase
VGMANFAPILNTRGCIYSNSQAIVLRSTYHVFDLYVNYLGDTVVDLWHEEPFPLMNVTNRQGHPVNVESVDLLATTWSDKPGISIAAINKHPEESQTIKLAALSTSARHVVLYGISGQTPDSYNDIGKNDVAIYEEHYNIEQNSVQIEMKPHSVNIIQIL